MSPKQTDWYLRKPDGAEYGPVTTSELQRWAAQCRIVAGNGVSADRENWLHVEDIPELEMDWMAHRPDGREYGPFNITATRELFEHDVLPEDAILTHRTTHKTVTVQQVLNENAQAPTKRKATPKSAKPAAAQKPESKPAHPKPAAAPQDPQDRSTQIDPVEATETAPSPTADETTEPPEQMEPPEVTALTQEVAKVRDRLKTAQGDLRQARKELANANAETVEITSSLRAECDDASKALTSLQQEMETLREQHLEEVEALTLERTTAQADCDEATASNNQAEAKLQTIESERNEAEEQTLQSVAELRKQTAFMKKNNATLQCELEVARAKGDKRGRWLVLLLSILAIVGATLLLAPIPSCQPTSETVASNTPKPEFSPPIHNEDPIGSTSGRTVAPPLEPPTESLAALASHTPAAPWPIIMVEGVKSLAESGGCTLRFDAGVFVRLTTPSTAAVEQLLEIAEILRPQIKGFELIVEGHTDDQPLKATAAYNGNYALGLARAEAIRTLLITKGKLPGNFIRARSAGGKTSPFPNDSAANRVRNRTVVLKLVRR